MGKKKKGKPRLLFSSIVRSHWTLVFLFYVGLRGFLIFVGVVIMPSKEVVQFLFDGIRAGPIAVITGSSRGPYKEIE